MAEREPLRKIKVNGAELHYKERGAGDVVVFVHGGLGDFRTWGPQMEPFAARYRVISYSRRGHYPNSWPEDYSEVAMMRHVEDLAALIQKLELGRVHVVANSYGGYISLHTARKYPHLVRTLALAEPPVHPLLRRLPGGDALLQEFMRDAWLPAGRAFGEGDMEGGVRFFIEGAVGKGEFDKLPPRVREAMMKNAPELAAATTTEFTVHMPDLTCSDLGEIGAPTLLMRGGLSPRMYYLINDELARCLPHAEQALIPDAAHVLHSHNPEAHNAVVLAFLKRHADPEL